VYISGGHSASGEPVANLDVAACEAFVHRINPQVDAYAVSAVFAVRNPAHERQVQTLIENLTGKPVSCGHHLSSGLDAPRRALTALLNARLIPMISALLNAAKQLLNEQQIKAPLMVVKGDGSLVSDEFAMRHPVETILSGPAASVVGAQFLCDKPRLLVSDMGGTTTDVALIEHGVPKLSKHGATVGGWRTMVKAVDINTYGLGGDSAIVFDTQRRKFTVGPQRVMSLSLFAQRYPQMLRTLESQLELPLSTTHSAQFVRLHMGVPGNLTASQQELYDQIAHGPIAIQSLFKDQTIDRALRRLEQRALVLRIGFTPSDACHILGLQNTWDNTAAQLGAKLLMRYAKDNLGESFPDCKAFAQHIVDQVSAQTALALVESVSHASEDHKALTPSQLELLASSFSSGKADLFQLRPTLSVPVMGLGAPAQSYYHTTARLLDTEFVTHDQAHVANALGAVVGSIQQQQRISINPAGGKQVIVLFPDGPQQFESLEAGAAAATEKAETLAFEKAELAGAAQPMVKTIRHDTIVGEGSEAVFFESNITATASGRPATQ